MTFEEASRGLSDLTLFDPGKLLRLWNAVKETVDVPGAMAELGVYRGGTALLLHRAKPRAPLLLFDTFAGLPHDDAEGPHKRGDFPASLESVQALFRGRLASSVRFLPGTFPDSAADLGSIGYSFVHVDADLERSTADAIAHFWPRLNPGGVMAFDDYGWKDCPGVKKVVDAFAAENGLVIDDHPNHLAILRKGMDLPSDRSGEPDAAGRLVIDFRHGFGDCVHFATMLHLWKRGGWDVAVRCEPNKEAIFDAAGIPRTDEAGVSHPWVYHAGFNSPTGVDGEGNKVWGNLNAAPMPFAGDRSVLWKGLRTVRTEGGANRIETEETRRFADEFLQHLPKPWVIFAPQGSNWKHRKDMTDDETFATIAGLLSKTAGSVIIADWDNRVRFPNSGRVRHVKRDAGHLDLRKFLAVMNRCHLTISVDTGPLHYAALTRCPTLGVFFDLHPTCVALPRRAFVPIAPKHRHGPSFRASWNLIECEGKRPTPGEVVEHAVRMMDDRQYTVAVGLDVLLRSLVDRCHGSTGLTRLADRRGTFDAMLREAWLRFHEPNVVETGVADGEDWGGAGCSTTLLSLLIDENGGSLESIDVDAAKIARAEKRSAGLRHLRFTASDSVARLRQREEPIDLLYLDSADRDGREEESRCLAEFEAAERLLTERSIVAVDDTVWDGRWRGLGASLVPRLLESGWHVLAAGYQTVMSRVP